MPRPAPVTTATLPAKTGLATNRTLQEPNVWLKLWRHG